MLASSRWAGPLTIAAVTATLATTTSAFDRQFTHTPVTLQHTASAARSAARDPLTTLPPDMTSGAEPAPSASDATDWGRRLSRNEKILWYGLAGVTYCGVAIFEKGILNWIIGPIWLVFFVTAGPALVDQVRGRRPERVPAGEGDDRPDP